MLDVNEYGVVALEERALTTIGGGDTGCSEIAYAIGYAVGWTLHLAYEVSRYVDSPVIGVPMSY